MIKNTPPTRRSAHDKPTQSRSVTPPAPYHLEQLLDHPGHQEFPLQAIQGLMRCSVAEHASAIPEFVENGAAEPNNDLRLLVTQDGHMISGSTAELLKELHQQSDWNGQCAYRVFHACPEAAARLTTPGTCIADLGVQSASIHLPHAQQWQLEHPARASQRFIFVLAGDVPKKNIATGFLLDHVVVLPATLLEVAECTQRQDATYVLLKAAQPQEHQAIYSPFDGQAYESFARAKDLLKAFE